ncbi:hypothetical protein FB451DRAFT_1554976, partial [Mycena latifolia]
MSSVPLKVQPTTMAPTLDSTIGAMEIGGMISTFLFGLVTIQAFTYFRQFGDDSWKIRSVVIFVWAVELIHTSLVLASVYTKTITFFGQLENLAIAPTSMCLSIAFTALIGPSVQAFYAFRILRLSGRIWIPALCWVICIVRFFDLLGCSIAAFVEPDVIKFKIRFWWLIVCGLALSAFSDALITIATCYYLWIQRSNGFQRTQNMVDMMIFWTIQTGLLTSITTVGMLIIFLAMDSFVWVALLFLVSRSFSNSLLSTLNSRSSIRQAGRSTDFVDIPTSFRAR